MCSHNEAETLAMHETSETEKSIMNRLKALEH